MWVSQIEYIIDGSTLCDLTNPQVIGFSNSSVLNVHNNAIILKPTQSRLSTEGIFQKWSFFSLANNMFHAFGSFWFFRSCFSTDQTITQ